MRLALDLGGLLPERIGGIENFACHVVRGVVDAYGRDHQLTAFAPRQGRRALRSLAPELRTTRTGPHRRRLERALAAGDHDVLFGLLGPLGFPAPAVPYAVVVPDLQHEFFPEYFGTAALAWRRRWIPDAVAGADVVFARSEFTKRTIVERLGAPAARIVVTYGDVDEDFRRPSHPATARALRRLSLPDEYVYYPANFWPHKNHELVLDAVKLLLRRGGERSPQLVLTGAPSRDARRVLTRAGSLGIADRVRFLGFRPRATTVEIMRGALALVYPTRFEGFGTPLLEAFHAAVPAISSRAGSCEEVAGDAALYVSVDDPAELADAITSVQADPGLRADLVRRGAARAARFSWAEPIAKVLGSLDRIAGIERPSQAIAPSSS